MVLVISARVRLGLSHAARQRVRVDVLLLLLLVSVHDLNARVRSHCLGRLLLNLDNLIVSVPGTQVRPAANLGHYVATLADILVALERACELLSVRRELISA